MPLPAPASRIAPEPPILRMQGVGNPTAGENTGAERQVAAPGEARAEGAFGVFGMMISGLIVLFAVVLLVLKVRRRG